MSFLQARRYQRKDADLDAVAVSGVAAAWTPYTPTVTAGSGTFTTVSATGRYLRIGKLMNIQIAVTITTNGTAAGAVQATLPATAGAGVYVLAGRETVVAGKMLQGNIAPGGTTVNIFNYDNSYSGSNGAILIVSGSYETA